MHAARSDPSEAVRVGAEQWQQHRPKQVAHVEEWEGHRASLTSASREMEGAMGAWDGGGEREWLDGDMGAGAGGEMEGRGRGGRQWRLGWVERAACLRESVRMRVR
jgi:hypothetical protein